MIRAQHPGERLGWFDSLLVIIFLLGIYMGTAAIVGYGFVPLSTVVRLCFGVAALAILVPPNAFPGAHILDWAGLGASIAVLGFDFLRSRSGAPASPAARSVSSTRVDRKAGERLIR